MTRAPVAEAAPTATRSIHIAGAGVVLGVAALIALQPSWMAWLPAAGFDAYQMLAPRQVVSMPATVVEIDEKSLAALGRWPWPRTQLAHLIDAIARHRPAAVGVDIFMPEPDPLSPEQVLARATIGPNDRYAALAALPSNDKALARALADAPTVLAMAGMHTATGMSLRVAPFVVKSSTPPSAAIAPVEPALLRFDGVLTSVDELNRAASGWGLISVDRAGGVLRRIPVAASVQGTLVPGFAIEVLRVALGVPSLGVVVSGSSVEGISLGRNFVPTESDGAVRVHFSPRSAERFVSAIDVLEGRVDGERLKQRMVIIGATALGLGENHVTPLGVSMPGSEIQAQLLESIFDGTLLVRPRWAPAFEAAMFAMLGALLVVTVPSWKPRHAAILALACVAVPIVGGYLLFRSQRLVLDGMTPGIGLLLLFGVLLLLTLTEANRQKRTLELAVQVQRENNARIAGELEAARRVQTATLPSPDLLRGDPRVELAATMKPALEVGGDLYDFFRLDARRLFLLVGDVAGKGLSASIFMAVSKALYKSATLRAPDAGIGALMFDANVEVSRDNPEMLFVTAFAAVLDLDTGELAYCNAGHEYPFVFGPPEGAVRRLDAGGGPPLCAVDRFVYEDARYRMRPGELLCVVSDGVTEARGRSGELYGSRRVSELLLRMRDGEIAPRAVVEALRADVESFEMGAVPADDVTVLALRWNGPQVSAR